MEAKRDEVLAVIRERCCGALQLRCLTPGPGPRGRSADRPLLAPVRAWARAARGRRRCARNGGGCSIADMRAVAAPAPLLRDGHAGRRGPGSGRRSARSLIRWRSERTGDEVEAVAEQVAVMAMLAVPPARVFAQQLAAFPPTARPPAPGRAGGRGSSSGSSRRRASSYLAATKPSRTRKRLRSSRRPRKIAPAVVPPRRRRGRSRPARRFVSALEASPSTVRATAPAAASPVTQLAQRWHECCCGDWHRDMARIDR